MTTTTQLPKVVISVINWNAYDLTAACLDSLARLDYPDYEVVVVDNASRDDSVAQLRERYPAVTLIESDENLGFAGGHRLALEYAQQDNNVILFWMLNNDTTVRPDALTKLVEVYQQMGDALYGGVALTPDDESIIDADPGVVLNGHTPTHHYGDVEAIRGKPYIDVFTELSPRKVAHLHGSSMLLPLSVVREHGFMDDRYFLYGEELDYCYTLTKQGIPCILVPQSLITHVRKGAAKRHNLMPIARYYTMRNYLYGVRRHDGFWAYLQSVRLYLRTCLNVLVMKPGYYRVHDPLLYYRCLGVRDSLLNRYGKTLAPEEFLNQEFESV